MLQKGRLSRLFGLGLQKVAGPCLLLDAELRIVGGTPDVAELLGGQLPLGARAPAVLCGENEKRPLAEALARGESVTAEIARLTPRGEHMVSVRSVPLKEGAGTQGHLLLLAPLGPVHDGVTEVAGIVTASESMRSLIRKIRKVAPSEASVLVRGETGSGKELVARALHEMSPRREKPFVAINCAALPADLLESELFGHERGAFTGAVRDNLGHFRQANGGTIFLDEVAELPLAMQAKLLRVTQERTVLPVGSTTPVPVDVRLVSATHRSLREAVQEGKFRADLMFRLRVIPLFLPPLRERPDDVELLARRFVASLNDSSSGRKVESISDGALAALRQHSWPGNVRELQNVLEYAFLLGEGPVLSEAELPDEVKGSGSPAEAIPHGNLSALSPEARRIHRALERAGGHRGRAAESLGISRATLWRKMKALE
jgi:transcriptional regulator with PAS, ATPase and Fis domain